MNPKDAAMLQAAEDLMHVQWSKAITTWAVSQRSRRIALRCAWYEERAFLMLIE